MKNFNSAGANFSLRTFIDQFFSTPDFRLLVGCGGTCKVRVDFVAGSGYRRSLGQTNTDSNSVTQVVTQVSKALIFKSLSPRALAWPIRRG